jgi:hypothetical protein
MERMGEPDGEYANCVEVGQNQVEFIVQFGRAFEGEPRRPVHTRIIMNPSTARELLELLREALDHYERDRAKQVFE